MTALEMLREFDDAGWTSATGNKLLGEIIATFEREAAYVRGAVEVGLDYPSMAVSALEVIRAHLDGKKTI